jgi:hypothetical protein
MITAKQLREQLALVPDDTPIILQTDDEGNGYRYIRGLDFEPLEHDNANMFDGNYGGECFRKTELDEDDTSDYHLVAVVF